MIELAQLEEMFAGAAARGKLDMTKPMLWGYFFTNHSRNELDRLVPLLEDRGYRFVDIFPAEVDSGQEPFLFLHVEKEEVHSPLSLFKRNAEFYALAELHGLDSYDGMDVGPIQKTQSPRN